jgi:ABC-type Fe3+ transport system substrate-binding protein
MNRRWMLLTVLALAHCATAMAQAPATAEQALPPTLTGLVAAAEKEGALNGVWGESLLGDNVAAQRYANMFNKRFGTHIVFSFAPGMEVARLGNQLFTEWQAGQPASSDLFAGSAPQMLPLVKRDALLPIPWADYLPGRIAADMVEGGGRALRMQTPLSGITYNTDLVPSPPTSLEDFLKPEWKGKVATTPYAAGFDVLAAKDLWGPERTLAYATKLSSQVAGLVRCGDVERIATGEFQALVMDCIGNVTQVWKGNGAPVAYVIVRDAAQRRFSYVSVPRNARHPAAAALFGVFLLTPEAQALMWDAIKIDLDEFKESHVAKLVADMQASGVKFTDVSIDWWGRHPEVDETKAAMIKILTSK